MANICDVKRWAGVGLLVVLLAGSAALGTGCQSPQPEKIKTVPPAIEELLAEMRAANARAKATYTIGFNAALLKPIRSLAGTVPPKNLLERAARHKSLGEQMLRLDLQARDDYLRTNNVSAFDRLWLFPELKISCQASLHSWDWRRAGAVSPVKDQQCGNCWAYASAGALESSNLIRNHQLIDVSEQYIVDCAMANDNSDAGTCGGGWHQGVFEYMIAHGVAAEASLHDSGVDHACDASISAPYRAVAWGYVDTPAPAAGFGDSIPTVDSIKQALCANGPLAGAVLATSNFQAYSGNKFGDTFNESLPDSTLIFTWDVNHLKYHAVNHDVLLIGWDDGRHAWLIKNSWGTDWGINAGLGAATDRGYMWIDYTSNNIGLGAAWVKAQHWVYKLPPQYIELVHPRIPFPDPGPLHIEELTQKQTKQ
jgi:cathepsin L